LEHVDWVAGQPVGHSNVDWSGGSQEGKLTTPIMTRMYYQ